MPQSMIWVLVLLGLGSLIPAWLVWSRLLKPWLGAYSRGIDVPFRKVVWIQRNGMDPRTIVGCEIIAHYAGYRPGTEAFIAHHQAGGDLNKLTSALMVAWHTKLELSWEDACALDLSEEQDVLQAVREEAQAQGHAPTEPPT